MILIQREKRKRDVFSIPNIPVVSSRCWRSEIDLAVSVQNLAEFSVVMMEKVHNPVPDETVSRFIRNIVLFDGWTIIS